ncbi:MAG: MFS transporter [Halobacteriales archaeon]|nr:MFS transporter [Halobacteriales archaeon]
MRAIEWKNIYRLSHPKQMGLIAIAHALHEFYCVALPPIIPLIVIDFDISYAQAGWLVTVFYVVYAIFQLPAGIIADKIGKRYVLGFGLVLLAFGVFLASRADTYQALLLSQVVAGIGGSTYHPAGLSAVSDLEADNTAGKAMGFHGLGGAIGTALAPAVIGGIILMTDSWRFSLSLIAIVGVVYAVVFHRKFAEPDNVVGNLEKKIVTRGENIRTQLKNFPWDPWVVGLVTVNFLLGVEIGAARTFTTSYVFLRSSEVVSFANTVFFVMLVGAGVSTIVIGPLADMFDKRNLGALTFVVTGFLLLLTGIIPPNKILLLGLFFLIGAMMWTTVPVMNALTSVYAKRDFSGMLFALTLTGSALGNSVGPFVFGLILERTDITIAYPAMAIFSVAGAIAFLAMKRF